VARLTVDGLAEFGEMERRADDAASGLLDALGARHRERLVGAMADVHRLLRCAGVRVERVDPASEEARWAVGQYCAELDRRFESGFDPAVSLAVSDDEMAPPRGSFLIATVDGQTVACGAVKGIDAVTCSIKRMWVADDMRGLGLGRRMLAAIEAEATALGFRIARLETNGSLAEAIALYETSGYRSATAFSDDPYAERWFEKRLAGPPVGSSDDRQDREG
jgi:GNAT superfamily N-acetyltransferase